MINAFGAYLGMGIVIAGIIVMWFMSEEPEVHEARMKKLREQQQKDD